MINKKIPWPTTIHKAKKKPGSGGLSQALTLGKVHSACAAVFEVNKRSPAVVDRPGFTNSERGGYSNCTHGISPTVGVFIEHADV